MTTSDPLGGATAADGVETASATTARAALRAWAAVGQALALVGTVH